jgi:tetratricopeptide (TPR) repeat protein
MLSASGLGEASATLELISSSIRNNSLDLADYAAPLKRLGILAKKEGDREAMTLLGKVLLSQRRENEALEWFRRATQGPTQSLTFESAGEALVNEGRLLLSRKDHDSAGQAFRKAALELDDPSAYFYLSQLKETGSAQHKVYLLKAASSGIVEAWHNLGSLELSEIEKRSNKATSIADYGLAWEWFQVAATDGFGLSMLNLALICKSVGKSEDGLKWLDKAETLPEVKEQARSMRAQWGNETVQIS